MITEEQPVDKINKFSEYQSFITVQNLFILPSQYFT